MYGLTVVPLCIILLHCLICTMALPPSNRDLRRLFAGSEPTQRNRPSIGARTAFPARVKVVQGKEVFEYAKLFFDSPALEKAVQEENIRFPREFWKGFFRNIVKRQPSDAGNKMFKKAFRFYLHSLKRGAVTVTGEMGGMRRKQKRNYGGELNALKCPELGQLLYTFFIDCVQSLRCRVDGNFLMREALFLKQRFVELGHEPTELPQLGGGSWKSWFFRWRDRFDVHFMKAVKHLKISWKKVKTRVRVFLKNVFVLRFLWKKCFGDTPMRWISWDQMPAWFNNTALDGSYAPRGHTPTIREIACHSRQRFSLCTCVDSATKPDDTDPPPLGLLFKAAPFGVIWKELSGDPNTPKWMHVQTQEAGSYRSSDMVHLLRKTLKPAVQLWESAIVMLDWYAGHRTPEIAHLIAELGHVLLLHGGGTTPYEQVNDTHLHARMKRLMKTLEIAVFYGQLDDDAAVGVKKACLHSRKDLINLIKTVWEELNHAALSQRGYEQTGPKLALDGPILTKDVGADMLPVFRALCPHEDPEQLGTQIRDEAFALVESYWGKQVHDWTDHHLLIEQHEEHPEMEEGEEALPVQMADPHDDTDDENDNGDDNGDDDMDGNDEEENGDEGDVEEEDEDDSCDDDEDDEDLDNHDNLGDDPGFSPTSPAPEDGEEGDSADIGHPQNSGPSSASTDVITPGSASSSAGNAPTFDQATVRLKMLDDAISAGDDVLVHYLRAQMSNSRRNSKGKTTLYTTMAASLAAEKQVRDVGKRSALEEARKTDLMIIKEKRLLVGDERNATESKRQKMAEQAADDTKRREMAKALGDEKKKSVWSQTVFPAEHAARMSAFIKDLTPEALSQHQAVIRNLHTRAQFDRWVAIPKLWETDTLVVHNFGTLPNLHNKFPASARRIVRCSPQLVAFIEHHTEYKKTHAGPQPEAALHHLLRACFIHSHLLFAGPWTAYNLLCQSDLVIDHAFIRAVLCASKWLGPKILPVGYIRAWPPPYPEEQL